jgi:beta-galactosidase
MSVRNWARIDSIRRDGRGGRRLISHLFAAVVLCGLACRASGADSPRQRISLDPDWRFIKGDPDDARGSLAYAKIRDWVASTGNEFLGNNENPATHFLRPDGNPGGAVSYVQPGFDDTKWRALDLPHDWAQEGPFDINLPGATGKLPWAGIGWYRKHFSLDPADQAKQIYLDIDGAMAYATVWCNGQFVGGWPYGYASFELDLTKYVKAGGDNVLAIRLDNPPDSSRWYPGGGIYRNVWLVKTAPVHVDHWGSYITTPNVSPASASVDIRIAVANHSAGDVNVTVKTLIYPVDGNEQIAGPVVASTSAVSTVVGSRRVAPLRDIITITLPRLWDLQKPQLYLAQTVVEQDGTIVDSYDSIFGIRSIKFDANLGFLLNGQHVKVNGVCDHHDMGAIGTAVNTRALERQIQLLQQMGCNAIRTSHNMPAPELLDLCDRMGMLVMDESFDCWARGKTANDYHLLFADWHEKDFRAEIRRDRNHPSIVIWSTGNELNELGRPEGITINTGLTAIVHEEDPTRFASVACNNQNAGYSGFQKTVDVFGYNYKPTAYAHFHQENPTIALYGSETSSCISSRGEYLFPVTDNKAGGQFRDRFQMSSYDLYAPNWATPPDTEFKGQDENPFVAGEFVWTGFDYLGEPTPYDQAGTPSRSSYFGIYDLAGFPKDRVFIYMAKWRPDFPMAHILPHWNWPDRIGQTTPVHVYTSGDEAELFLNGKSLGRKKKNAFEYRIRWDDVRYQPGELKVVAYKNGVEWAQDVVKTTGAAAGLAMSADRPTIKADGQDLCYVTIRVVDSGGQTVPRSMNGIRFTLSGPGQIVATDNGDPTDLVSFPSPDRKAFNGLCLAIVKAKSGAGGPLILSAQSDGLQASNVVITAAP